MRRLSDRGKGESPKLLIRIPAEVIRALKKKAKAKGLVYSDYVRNILLDHLKKG